MDISAIYHEVKSKYSYLVDKHTLHIWIRTKKDDVSQVNLVTGDPFNWIFDHEEDKFVWQAKTAKQEIMEKKYTTKYHDYYFGIIKSETRRVRYGFKLTDGNTELFFGPQRVYENKKLTDEQAYDIFNYYNFPFLNSSDIFSSPKWARDTRWYQILPDRFFNKDNEGDFIPWEQVVKGDQNTLYGGNIKGVIEKLDYIKELGFNGIYFTPLFDAYSYHKYDTTDYYNIDPSFGTNDDFKELVKQAHSKGIKVMLDAVFNHCGWFHPFWQDVLKNKEKSKYYDCFNITNLDYVLQMKKDEFGAPIDDYSKVEYPGYDTFAYTPLMPKWNTTHPLVEEELLGATAYWIIEMNIDAWRLDVSNEVSHHFWRKFNKVVKGINKEVLIVGENMDNAYPWIGPDQFDSVMNYDASIPVYSYFLHWEDRFSKINKQEFIELMNEKLVSYPRNMYDAMYNCLDTHDTSRLLTLVNDNKDLMRLPIIFMYTYPGSPSIYYGTEKLLNGAESHHQNRKPMPWHITTKETESMEQFIKILNQCRDNYEVFKVIDIRFIETSNSDVLGYTKDVDCEQLLVLLNNSDQAQSYQLSKMYEGYKSIFDDKVESIQSGTLQPYGYKVLVKG